jgi:hypothetical protein
MIRFLATVVLLALISLLLLLPVSASGTADPTIEPTPTVQPTSEPFEVEVVVETQGVGIPDDAVIETDFGNNSGNRHENLGPNHYQDFLKVPLDSSVMWIFEHEGDLSTGGQRNDESWGLFPYIVPTPLTLTVLIHTPVALCQDPTIKNCNSVTGIGDQPVFILDHNKSYDINLSVDYTRGASHNQDSFTVTSTIH